MCVSGCGLCECAHAVMHACIHKCMNTSVCLVGAQAHEVHESVHRAPCARVWLYLCILCEQN